MVAPLSADGSAAQCSAPAARAGLDDGEYYVKTSNFLAFADQLYEGVPCSNATLRGCPVERATRVGARLTRETRGIDFSLEPQYPQLCFGSSTTACLGDRRFAATVEWRDFTGATGRGRLVTTSDDSAFFWFFTESNWELMVKVVDACRPPFDRFWVFSAATTNVEYTLRVQDSKSGEVWTYHNPAGTAAPAITDTAAFDSCP